MQFNYEHARLKNKKYEALIKLFFQKATFFFSTQQKKMSKTNCVPTPKGKIFKLVYISSVSLKHGVFHLRNSHE